MDPAKKIIKSLLHGIHHLKTIIIGSAISIYRKEGEVKQKPVKPVAILKATESGVDVAIRINLSVNIANVFCFSLAGFSTVKGFTSYYHKF